MITGKINEPVKMVAATATGDWTQTAGPTVNLRIELDRKSASFTPSENGLYKFQYGNEMFEVQVGEGPGPEPEPEPEPQPTPEGLIFDSNVSWVGTVGQIVSGKFGNTEPNGKGFYTAASGSPKLKFVTPTEYELIGSGSGIHPRIYGAVCNYNARFEMTFKFNSSSVDNITGKIRNRHGMGGDCDNRVGGFGFHFERGVGGIKIEICHNEHESGKEFKLPENLVNGKWYRAAFTVKDVNDGKGILQELQLDYLDGKGFRQIGNVVYTGTRASYFNKALFEQHSEFWIRYNGGSGSVGFKDVKMFKL